MFKVVVYEIKPDKTEELVREPQYDKFEKAQKVADDIFTLLRDKVIVNIIDLDTNEIIYNPSEVK